MLKPKAIAVMTVKRSRLRSTTLEAAAAEPTPPPNISERPPPFPLWSRIEMTRATHSTIWIEMHTHVTHHLAGTSYRLFWCFTSGAGHPVAGSNMKDTTSARYALRALGGGHGPLYQPLQFPKRTI